MAGKVKCYDIICNFELAPECIYGSFPEKQEICSLAIEVYNGAELQPLLYCAGFSSLNKDISQASVYLLSPDCVLAKITHK